MGFFQTKDPKTGEPKLGAGVYIIICLLMVGAVVLWNVRQNAQEPSLGGDTKPSGPVNPSVIQPIAQAAKDHQETTDSGNPPGVASATKSVRTGTDLASGPNPDPTANIKKAMTEDSSADTIQNTLDLIRQSNAKAEKEKQEAVDKAKADAQKTIQSLQTKALVTSSAEENTPANTNPDAGRAGTLANGDEQIQIQPQQLVVYDSMRDTPKKVVLQKEEPTGFETDNFLPRGFFFPVYLLTTVQTVNQEDMVIMGVAENVIFQHKVQIPFGTRLLGQAGSSNFEDRVMINVDTILYPDGRELPISAFLKDASDLSSGVKGYYIPQPARVQLAPYVSAFIETWSQATAERFARYSQNSNSGGSSSGQSTQQAYQEASQLISDQARKIQEKLDRRYPEKVVIPIGTKAFVQLRGALDLTQAVVNGSAHNRQPILPGFGNNPIQPSGVVERTANDGAQVTNATPARTAPQPTAQQAQDSEAQAAQQAAVYEKTLNQLSALQSQLNATGSRSPSAAPASSSNVNWPKGDIQ